MRPPVQIRIERLDAARALFRKVRDLGADPTELLDVWGATLEASTRRRFDTGTAPGGTAWPISWRAKEQGGKTLVDKGNLESSIRYEVRPGVLEVGVDGAGASSKFAFVHQFGAVIRPKDAKALRFQGGDGTWRMVQEVTIPQRAFLGVDQDDRDDMKDVAIAHLEELTNG